MQALQFGRAALQTLAILGSTADEIATSLERKGITGDRVMSDSCPLANFLRTEFPDDDVIVGPSVLRRRNERVSTTKLTSAQAEFTYRFDQGQYPFLDAEETALP